MSLPRRRPANHRGIPHPEALEGLALLYLGLIACAWSARQQSPNAPYALAIGLVALTILGIRNAWDLVTFIAPRSAATTE